MTDFTPEELNLMDELIDNLSFKFRDIERNIYSSSNPDLSETVLQVYEMKKMLEQIRFAIVYISEEQYGRKKDKSR